MGYLTEGCLISKYLRIFQTSFWLWTSSLFMLWLKSIFLHSFWGGAFYKCHLGQGGWSLVNYSLPSSNIMSSTVYFQTLLAHLLCYSCAVFHFTCAKYSVYCSDTIFVLTNHQSSWRKQTFKIFCFTFIFAISSTILLHRFKFLSDRVLFLSKEISLTFLGVWDCFTTHSLGFCLLGKVFMFHF